MSSAAKKRIPIENLWLATLMRDARLRSMSDKQVRSELLSGQFPNDLIEAFLVARKLGVPT